MQSGCLPALKAADEAQWLLPTSGCGMEYCTSKLVYIGGTIYGDLGWIRLLFGFALLVRGCASLGL